METNAWTSKACQKYISDIKKAVVTRKGEVVEWPYGRMTYLRARILD
jgi:hypothetical protein